jgi:DNA-binding winged helix-turn-helix (wHTH) protein/Tol biopolymer transport system component
MASPSTRPGLIRFGPFVLDPTNRELRKRGYPVRLQPQQFAVLLLLIEHAGQIVSREEIHQHIWGNDTFVDFERGINFSINQIRAAMGDDADKPRYVETIPRRGYRFIGRLELEPIPKRSDISAPEQTVSRERRSLSRSGPLTPASIGYFWAAAMPAFLAIGMFLLAPSRNTGPLDARQITFSSEHKKGPLFTDGPRLYFISNGQPSETTVGGGLIVPMRSMTRGLNLLDISTDASQMLSVSLDPNDNLGRGTLWSANMIGGTAHKISDHLAQAARWSRDGKSIVFADLGNLYQCDTDGGNRRQLWSSSQYIDDLNLSPDGRRLTMSISQVGMVNQTYLKSHIWMANSDGSDAHPLQLDWRPNANSIHGQWTRDGRHFFFLSDDEGVTNLYEVVPSPWFAFWKKPAAMRLTANQVDVESVASGRDPNVLFTLGRIDQGAMQVFDPRLKDFVSFRNGFSARDFIISPDGKWMAYTAYPGGQLWKSRIDGTEPQKLTDTFTSMEQWSPDGKWIVYSNWKKLYRVSVEGGVSEKLTSTGDMEVFPSWGPDGKSIYFSYYPFPGQPLSGIRILDLATKRISLMPGTEKYALPSWSPNGKYLIAIGQDESRVVIYSPKTREWRDLTMPLPWGFWVWSRDSKSLYMGIVDTSGLYRISVPQGKLEKLATMERFGLRPEDAFLSLSPDGQPTVMAHIGTPQIYSLRWKP